MRHLLIYSGAVRSPFLWDHATVHMSQNKIHRILMSWRRCAIRDRLPVGFAARLCFHCAILEEAYEVTDAIERGDMHDLKDELGDLLLQVVFHARMAEEADLFGNDVVDAIADKMIRRHPHVFGDGDADNPEAVRQSWEEIKAQEKPKKANPHGKPDG